MMRNKSKHTTNYKRNKRDKFNLEMKKKKMKSRNQIVCYLKNFSVTLDNSLLPK